MCWAAAAVSVLWGTSADADDCLPTNRISGCVDAEALWARAGDSPYTAIGPGATTPRGRVAFEVQLSYLKRPIVAQAGAPNADGRSVYLVDNLFDGAFLFALGVTDRFELTLSAPIAFYEDGAGTGFLSGTGKGLPRSTARDGRFGFSYAFLAHPRDLPPNSKKPSVSVIGRFEIGAPYGSGMSFSRARTATLVPAVTGDLRVSRFDVTAEIGARIRGETELLDATWGTQLAFLLGASARVWDPARLTVGAEAFALPGLSSQKSGVVLTPAEWMVDAGVAPFLGGDIGFVVSGGGSIPTATSETGALERGLTSPLYRFGATLRYAPTGRPTPAPPSSGTQ